MSRKTKNAKVQENDVPAPPLEQVYGKNWQIADPNVKKSGVRVAQEFNESDSENQKPARSTKGKSKGSAKGGSKGKRKHSEEFNEEAEKKEESKKSNELDDMKDFVPPEKPIDEYLLRVNKINTEGAKIHYIHPDQNNKQHYSYKSVLKRVNAGNPSVEPKISAASPSGTPVEKISWLEAFDHFMVYTTAKQNNVSLRTEDIRKVLKEEHGYEKCGDVTLCAKFIELEVGDETYSLEDLNELCRVSAEVQEEYLEKVEEAKKEHLKLVEERKRIAEEEAKRKREEEKLEEERRNAFLRKQGEDMVKIVEAYKYYSANKQLFPEEKLVAVSYFKKQINKHGESGALKRFKRAEKYLDAKEKDKDLDRKVDLYNKYEYALNNNPFVSMALLADNDGHLEDMTVNFGKGEKLIPRFIRRVENLSGRDEDDSDSSSSEDEKTSDDKRKDDQDDHEGRKYQDEQTK